MLITFETKLYGTVSFAGRLLGQGTSHKDQHNHPGDRITASRDPVTGRQIRCSSCRWQEVYIYEDADRKNQFVVYTIGRTTLPDETDYETYARTDSAMEVREILTVRRKDAVFMPDPAKRALAQAAELDEDLRDVYDTLPAGL